MTRLLLCAALLTPASAWAVGIVPPIVRTEKAEGDTPPPAPGGDEDPLKTIERITKTAREVGDRLRNEDAGADTQKSQDQLLKDIDSLLKPPPPMGGGGGGGGSPPPPSGANDPPPQGGNSGNPPPPMGSSGGGSNSKRPRGDRKQDQGGGQKGPMPMGGSGQKDPMPMGGDPMKEPMGAGGSDTKPMGGSQGGTGGRAKPDLPLEDPFTKRVWGHLPEKVRQQAMQSYREQFMPRYADLLKQYYSTLNEKQSPTPMK